MNAAVVGILDGLADSGVGLEGLVVRTRSDRLLGIDERLVVEYLEDGTVKGARLLDAEGLSMSLGYADAPVELEQLARVLAADKHLDITVLVLTSHVERWAVLDLAAGTITCHLSLTDHLRAVREPDAFEAEGRTMALDDDGVAAVVAWLSEG